MARFERSSERKTRGSRRDSRETDSFEDHVKKRGRGFSGGDRRGRREVELTEVICSSCGVKCKVPFKPTSTKPVYCSDCFVKKERSGSDNNSSKDLEIIKQKLNKIMEALKIE